MRSMARAAALFCSTLLLATPAHAAASDPFATCAKPAYPLSSLRNEESGTVTLSFKIGPAGTVLDSKVLRSSGFPLLDAAARDGLARCTFPPPKRGKDAWMPVQYVWTLAGPTKEELAAELAALIAGEAKGDPKATGGLGIQTLYGYGVKRDPERGLQLLQKAGELGYFPAYEVLGNYKLGGFNTERNVPEGERWHRLAASQGWARSQATLGRLLIRGDGVPARRDEGMAWLRKAAEQGDALGQSYLGKELLTLAGDEGDTSEAIAWLTKAAVQDEREAQASLGQVYRYGLGVKVDYVQAAEWLAKGARGGNHDARTALESMYAAGQAVRPVPLAAAKEPLKGK